MGEVSAATTNPRLRPLGMVFLTSLLILLANPCPGLPIDENEQLPSPSRPAIPLPRSLDILAQSSQQNGCSRPVRTCLTLSNSTCLDSPLDYSSSSFALANLTKEWEARIELKRWSVLKAAPKCWEKVQPLLCSVLMPRCYQDGDKSFKVELASKQLCELTRGPCRIVEEELGGWPDYFKCENRRVFSDRSWTVPCDGGGVDYSVTKRTKFKFSKGQCVAPLVDTSRPEAYFASFGGCSMRCRHPRYSDKDYESTRRWVGIAGVAGVVIFSFASLAHVWSWHDGADTWNRVLLMAYASWTVLSMGLAQQVFVGDDLVCGEEGTLRTEGGWCYLNFFLLYCGFLSLLMWIGYLFLCWKVM
jgi:smoothened protein